jgi:hypothetical protein
MLSLCAGFSAEAAQCTAVSGPHTTALVELYTSERCSSCPPADRWLSSLGTRGYVPRRVVPVALHVDSFDYIGWKDPYAKRELSLRQRKLTRLQRLALVFTPQVMLQGRDFRGWGKPAFEEALARINARPAAARITLEIIARESRALRVRAHAELSDPAFSGDPAVYLAAYENRLENPVVLEWQGPFAVPGGRFGAERPLPLLPGAVPTNSGVVAFVQDRRTAEVLQALMLPACPQNRPAVR